MEELDVIKFRVSGLLNSYKIPFYRTYHRSYLSPPKTMIIGMLCNIMRLSEKDYYEILKQDAIKISVVIEDIKGTAKDFWVYKINQSKNNGRGIIRRDKLYNPKYCIYLSILTDDLKKDIINALKCPKSIPSLGLDDELVTIYDINESQKLKKVEDAGYVNSVFINKYDKYTSKFRQTKKFTKLPISNPVNLGYQVEYKGSERKIRKAAENALVVEFLNCSVNIPEKEIYTDNEYNIVFQ